MIPTILNEDHYNELKKKTHHNTGQTVQTDTNSGKELKQSDQSQWAEENLLRIKEINGSMNYLGLKKHKELTLPCNLNKIAI